MAAAAALAVVAAVAVVDLRTLAVKNPRVARATGQQVSVKVVPVRTEEITEIVGATALVEAVTQVELNALVAARVLAVEVDVGSWVRRHQALVRLDPSLLQAALDSARANVEKARRELEKLQQTQPSALEELRQAVARARAAAARAATNLSNAQAMWERKQVLLARAVIALAEFEQAEADLQAARAEAAAAQQALVAAENALRNAPVVLPAQLAQARASYAEAVSDLARAERDLLNAVVRAPEAGVVTERKVDPGESVRPGDPVVSVGKVESIMAVARVAEEKVARVALGQRAEVVLDAFPDEVFTGTVAKIDPTTDAKTRTFRAYVRMRNPDRRFTPGLAGYVRIPLVRRALTVPSLAVVRNAGEATVFVVAGDRARLRAIQARPVALGKEEVLGGLREGELVVYHKLMPLRDNDPVSIADDRAPGT